MGLPRGYKLTDKHRKRISKALKRYFKTHTSHSKGRKPSAEHRRRISRALRAYYRTHDAHSKGRKHTPEARAKMSKAVKKAYKEGRLVPWNKGKELPAQIRKHISEGHIEYFKTHAHPLRGTKTPKIIVRKQVAGRLRYYKNNPVWNSGKRHSNGTHKKMSEAVKRRWKERKKGNKMNMAPT